MEGPQVFAVCFEGYAFLESMNLFSTPQELASCRTKCLHFGQMRHIPAGQTKRRSASVSPGLQVHGTCNMGVMNSYE